MYVYILKSKKNSSKYYVGSTINLKNRLNDHNYGRSTYSKHFRPWALTTAFWFQDKAKAVNFEKYLKSHSGRAFRSKHF